MGVSFVLTRESTLPVSETTDQPQSSGALLRPLVARQFRRVIRRRPHEHPFRTRIQDQLIRSLKDHERELVEAQQLTHLGTWAWDTVSGELTWSDELYRIFELSREEFTPSCHEVLRRVRSSHRAQSRAAMQAALVDGEPCAFECPITLASGAQRWIRTVGVVDVAPGAPVRMHGTAQDITDFRMSDPAEATLAAGESALHDPLTGLASWHLFANRTAAALARATRDGSSTALLIIDIDQLHDVNDQFGHETGDLRAGGYRPTDRRGVPLVRHDRSAA